MTLDPEAQHFLAAYYSLKNPPLHTLGAVEARKVYASRPKHLAPPWVELHKVTDLTITTDQDTGANITPIPLRIYTPTASTTPLPMLIFYHGGGMVIGSVDGYDTLCRQLATQSNCIIISVDYRLAPENKFPCAVEDAYQALLWTIQHGALINGNVHRIAVGGDSAGGNLAAVVAILSRDQQQKSHKRLPEYTIKLQLLVYPATAPYADSVSHHTFSKGFFLERETALWFHNSYLRSDTDRDDFRYAPLLCDDFNGVAPAVIIVAEHDILRDEGIAYAKRLQKNQVTVELHEYKGMFHPFLSLAGALKKGELAITECAHSLKKYLL